MGFQSERDVKLDSKFYDLGTLEDIEISNHLQEDSDNFIIIDEKIEGNKVKGENYRNLAEDLWQHKYRLGGHEKALLRLPKQQWWHVCHSPGGN
jgi:hypothetical protein